jgi:hypothetical protein
LAVVRLYVALPRSAVSYVLGRQLLKSGTSVGAHYRECGFRQQDRRRFAGTRRDSLLARTPADASLAKREAAGRLAVESNELIAIFVSMVKRVKLASMRPEVNLR